IPSATMISKPPSGGFWANIDLITVSIWFLSLRHGTMIDTAGSALPTFSACLIRSNILLEPRLIPVCCMVQAQNYCVGKSVIFHFLSARTIMLPDTKLHTHAIEPG